MKKIKRYKAAGTGVVKTDSKGDLVLYSDYARLKAEVDKWKSWAEAEHAEKKVIKAEVERLKAEPDALTAYLYADTLRRDDIKTLKAHIERLTKAGWQPVETAPKNGSWIIVCWNELKCGCEDLDEWLPGMKIVRWHWGAWHFCSEYSIGANPTHWMPLPSEPAKEGKQS